MSVKETQIPSNPLESRVVIRTRVDATNYVDATHLIIQWAGERKPCYVCAANVHMLMEAYDDKSFSCILANSILVTPDGMPLVWALKLLGVRYASRVYGPTLTLHVCKAAAEFGIPIGLYGGTDKALKSFKDFLVQNFSGIQIVCKIAPPFRPLTPEEDVIYIEQIKASGCQILLVGIGCPKQEKWMAAHVPQIPAVMIGVGAAFDFHSGRVKQAPTYLQNIGFEWLFRLAMEPRRLWKRYAYNNPRFVVLFLKQYINELLKKVFVK